VPGGVPYPKHLPNKENPFHTTVLMVLMVMMMMAMMLIVMMMMMNDDDNDDDDDDFVRLKKNTLAPYLAREASRGGEPEHEGVVEQRPGLGAVQPPQHRFARLGQGRGRLGTIPPATQVRPSLILFGSESVLDCSYSRHASGLGVWSSTALRGSGRDGGGWGPYHQLHKFRT
jgi:hypothetical protein